MNLTRVRYSIDFHLFFSFIISFNKLCDHSTMRSFFLSPWILLCGHFSLIGKTKCPQLRVSQNISEKQAVSICYISQLDFLINARDLLRNDCKEQSQFNENKQ